MPAITGVFSDCATTWSLTKNIKIITKNQTIISINNYRSTISVFLRSRTVSTFTGEPPGGGGGDATMVKFVRRKVEVTNEFFLVFILGIE